MTDGRTARDRPSVAALGAAPAVGVVVGVVFTLAHGLLPERWAVLAGTSALWGVAPMVVARVAARRSESAPGAGAVVGLLAMAGTLVPWLTVHADSTSGAEAAMWALAGTLAGAICGTAGAVSAVDGNRGAVAAGAVPGIVAGEAVYGLLVVGGPAWAVELLIAAALLAAVSDAGRRGTALVSAAAVLVVAFVACVGYDAVLS